MSVQEEDFIKDMKSVSLMTQRVGKEKSRSLGLVTALVILLVAYTYLTPQILILWGLNEITGRYFMAMGSYVIAVGSILFFGADSLETLSDRFSLWVIGLGPLILTTLPVPGAGILIKVSFAVLALTLWIYAWINRKRLKAPDPGTSISGLLWAALAVIVLASIQAWATPQNFTSFPQKLPATLAGGLLFGSGLIAIPEELIVRGLLFSLLRLNKMEERKALIIQAVLFWGAHWGGLTNPMLFFVLLPIAIFFQTLIIKKYRMLYPSIIMHAFINVFPPLLSVLIVRLVTRA